MPPEESELGVARRALDPRGRSARSSCSRPARRSSGPATFWFHGAWVAEAQAELRALAGSAGGGFTASEARERLGTTRKYIIPLLEALDDKGFSKRLGDKRVIR